MNILGKSGDIKLNKFGDREPDYLLLNYYERERIHVCTFKTNGDRCESPGDIEVKVKWPGGRTEAPKDSPECGFKGEKCNSKWIYCL